MQESDAPRTATDFANLLSFKYETWHFHILIWFTMRSKNKFINELHPLSSVFLVSSPLTQIDDSTMKSSNNHMILPTKVHFVEKDHRSFLMHQRIRHTGSKSCCKAYSPKESSWASSAHLYGQMLKTLKWGKAVNHHNLRSVLVMIMKHRWENHCFGSTAEPLGSLYTQVKCDLSYSFMICLGSKRSQP